MESGGRLQGDSAPARVSPREALRHHLPDEELCITCGACLPVCPTYSMTGLERESPRGRTQLVRAVAEDRLQADGYFAAQMYDCLDCRACDVICPVGVPIGSLVLEGRAAAQLSSNTSGARSPLPVRLGKWLLEHAVFAHPRRMEVPVFLMGLYQRSGLRRVVRATGILRLVPLLWRLERWLPDLSGRPWRWRYRAGGELLPAHGVATMRAAYFLGCFMNTVFADASVASVEVLRRNGVEVVTPRRLRCCGAPQMDLGDVELAREFARANIEILEATGATVVFSDCAACSGMLKEYGSLLKDDSAWSARAARVSARARDFSELAMDLVRAGPPLGRVDATATYHDPCHLAHLQRITNQPRELLRAIPGLRYVELPNSDTCCGSAGTYSFRRWDQSMAFVDEKVAWALSTGADIVVTANPGCLGQLELGLRRAGSSVSVRHVSQLLLEAYDARVEGDPDDSAE